MFKCARIKGLSVLAHRATVFIITRTFQLMLGRILPEASQRIYLYTNVAQYYKFLYHEPTGVIKN